MKKVSLFVLLTCISFYGEAQTEGPYASGNLSIVGATLTTGGAEGDSSPLALNVALGNRFNQNFAIEAFFGIGIGDDEVENASFDFEVDNVMGAALVGIFPYSEKVEFFGKVGFVQANYDDTDGDSSDASGAMFGGGVNVNFEKRYGMFGELLFYPDGEYDDFDIEIEDTVVLNVGFKAYF